MRSRIVLVLITVLCLAILPMAAQDKTPAKKPMAMCGHDMGMKAMHDKIQNTWKDVQKATTAADKEAAMKAHGEALAEMEAAHQKMAAGGCCGGDMAACKQKMGEHKGKMAMDNMAMEKGMDCPCCTQHDMTK